MGPFSESASNLRDVVSNTAAYVALASGIFAIFAALRSGVLRSLRLGPLEIQGAPGQRREIRAMIEGAARPASESLPFETEQLALYYSQVLVQSKISFWFSLIFASLGFAVIVIAGFMSSNNASGATVAQFTAGVIMDAVSALFFVQSKNAQAAMGDFFDKLRLDRQQAESRKLCESLTDPRAKDVLRIQLALHYAEIKDTERLFEAFASALFREKVADIVHESRGTIDTPA